LNSEANHEKAHSLRARFVRYLLGSDGHSLSLFVCMGGCMTYASLILTALLIAFIVGAIWWLDSQLPSAEQEEQQAKRDVEEMLQRANRETQDRPRVRAGTNY
jgi:hypothetical protein